MLTPSYSELIDIFNNTALVDSKITSRYTIVLAAAKRARQLIHGANPLTYAPTDRAVSIAVKEMNEGKLTIKFQEDLLEGDNERIMRDQYRYRNMTLSKDDLREDLKENYEPDVYEIDTDSDEVDFSDTFGVADPDLEDDEKADYTLYDDDFTEE